MYFLLLLSLLHPVQYDTIRVDSLSRSFCYYIPKGITAHPRLIFVLHGSGMQAQDMQPATGEGFESVSDASGDAIIVYPQGYHQYWNDCRRLATYDAKLAHINEPEFFAAMIDYFRIKYQIDTSQVFAAGFSNGGHMCYKLAMEMPELFKAIAVVSASLPVDSNDDCYHRPMPISMMIINGTRDPYNLYQGGEVQVGDGKRRGAVRSTEETIKYWATKVGADISKPKVYRYPDSYKADSSTVTSYTYVAAHNATKVVLLKIENGGHVFPTSHYQWSPSLGLSNRDIDAARVIMDFFTSHSPLSSQKAH